MEKNKLKKTVDTIMNNHKADSISFNKANPKGINTGEKTLYRPDGKRFKILNFAGKKTKTTRILHNRGEVQAGTLWEDIPAYLKNELNWQESDFKN